MRSLWICDSSLFAFCLFPSHYMNSFALSDIPSHDVLLLCQQPRAAEPTNHGPDAPRLKAKINIFFSLIDCLGHFVVLMESWVAHLPIRRRLFRERKEAHGTQQLILFFSSVRSSALACLFDSVPVTLKMASKILKHLIYPLF